jgi:ribonuclease P protein component
MIIQRHRFHGHNSVQKVYKTGLAVRGQGLGLKFARRDAGKPYRAAVVVSRKVSKSAVVRNRIRRRIYEVIRQNIDDSFGGYDLVVTVFAEQVATMEAPKLQSAIKRLLDGAQTLNTSSVQHRGHGIVKSDNPGRE